MVDCRFKNDKLGLEYDLTALRKDSSYYSGNVNGLNQDQNFIMYYNFCLLNGLDVCKDQDSNACMAVDSSTQYQVGSLNYVDSQDADMGIVLIYNSEVFAPSGLNNCSTNGNRRTFRLNLSCFDVDYMVSDGQENERCVYDFIGISRVMCVDCPDPLCSNHGVCNKSFGKCDCDSQTTGQNCSESNIWVSSSISTSIQGGETSIYGYFGDTSTQLKVFIGDLECTGPKNISQREIKCQAPASTIIGFKNITIYDGDVYYSGKDLFKYTSNQQSSQCLDNCFSEKDQGECIEDQCICKTGFIGINCGTKSSSSSSPNNNNNNHVNSTTAGITINSEYLINIYSLVELNIQGEVTNEIILNNNWIVVQNSTQYSDVDTIIFKQPLNNSGNNSGSGNNSNNESTIEYKIEIIKDKFKQYSFAGLNFTLDQGSIKISIKINSFKYSSSLNTLQLRILSGLDESGSSDDCNKEESSINTFSNNNYNYLQITKDQRVFQGTIINKLISDGRPTYISTTIVNQNETLVLYGLNLPHFTDSCILDPNFQLLVSQDYKESCGSSSNKWLLPVVIVVPVFGLALIIIISAIVYKNNIIKFKILKSKLFKTNNSIKNVQLE